ncbi:hypothetical protein PanWU01x14_182690 [Parasponia andersonii]|uniref:Uncharacterized protein n=1 Tax=Parasponia andersonii TaxID=3476 RepID=A0A2P5C5E6_PARAD|nr:hypothetical protein PanWU01x14_182690 [Parasponia andersonii]
MSHSVRGGAYLLRSPDADTPTVTDETTTHLFCDYRPAFLRFVAAPHLDITYNCIVASEMKSNNLLQESFA